MPIRTTTTQNQAAEHEEQEAADLQLEAATAAGVAAALQPMSPAPRAPANQQPPSPAPSTPADQPQSPANQLPAAADAAAAAQTTAAATPPPAPSAPADQQPPSRANQLPAPQAPATRAQQRVGVAKSHLDHLVEVYRDVQHAKRTAAYAVNTSFERQFAVAAAMLRPHGLRPVEVPGDGHCCVYAATLPILRFARGQNAEYPPPPQATSGVWSVPSDMWEFRRAQWDWTEGFFGEATATGALGHASKRMAWWARMGLLRRWAARDDGLDDDDERLVTSADQLQQSINRTGHSAEQEHLEAELFSGAGEQARVAFKAALEHRAFEYARIRAQVAACASLETFPADPTYAGHEWVLALGVSCGVRVVSTSASGLLDLSLGESFTANAEHDARKCVERAAVHAATAHAGDVARIVRKTDNFCNLSQDWPTSAVVIGISPAAGSLRHNHFLAAWPLHDMTSAEAHQGYASFREAHNEQWWSKYVHGF